MGLSHVRDEFPFLSRQVNGRPIIYLDNGATTQKPRAVVNRMVELYSTGISNVHRAMNLLAEEVTEEYERARDTAAFFLNSQPGEVVFVPNATFGLNLISRSLACRGPLRVISTTLEHHSNFLPWGPGSPEGVDVRYVRWFADGTLDLDDLRARLAEGADLVAIASASNFVGALRPMRAIANLCREAGVSLLVDASQSVAHTPTDVLALDCDYLVFSGHKVYGPGGTGVLYIRRTKAEELSPVLVGGSMVKEVQLGGYTLNDIPHRFEPGTPNIDGVIGLGAALSWLSSLGWESVEQHERELTEHAKRRLAEIPGCRIHGPAAGEPSAPLVAFSVDKLDSHAITKTLSLRSNIIVRSGFHCAQPAHTALNLGPTVRASFAVYNTVQEVEEMAGVVASLVRSLR